MTFTMIYYISHEHFSKIFLALLNALETVNQAGINMSTKRDTPFSNQGGTTGYS